MLKVKNNVPLSPEEKAKQKWPFHEMKVGNSVDILDKKMWLRAQRTAHSLAKKQKTPWEFQTVWMEKEKIGRIRRVK